MEAIERAANISVGRACGFGCLAILCFMVGFSYQPYLAARVGGSMALLMAAILFVKAWLAARTPYKQTETWLILDDADRPPAEHAQVLIANTLRRIFLIYARYAALLSIVLLGASIFFGIPSG